MDASVIDRGAVRSLGCADTIDCDDGHTRHMTLPVSKPASQPYGGNVGSGLGSRKRSAAGLIAIALIMAMLIAACGGSGDDSDSDQGGPTHHRRDRTGDEGKPDARRRGHLALAAESSGGWCLPEAQLAISGIQVARAIYDTLAVPTTRTSTSPYLADKITPERRLHRAGRSTFAPASSSTTALRSTRQVVKDNLDAYRGKLPEPVAAAVHVRVRQRQGRHGRSTR